MIAVIARVGVVVGSLWVVWCCMGGLGLETGERDWRRDWRCVFIVLSVFKIGVLGAGPEKQNTKRVG